MIRGRAIYADTNDDEPEHTLTRKNASTGDIEAATGLNSLTFTLAATPTGSAIDPSLTKSAQERGTLGVYYATFEGTDLAAHLASYVGKDVYQIFTDNANINYVVARLVRAPRP